VKTEVEFRSRAFNRTAPKQYFINECCFGDDVCRWLIEQLRSRGISVMENDPGQEDFGWSFSFEAGGRSAHFHRRLSTERSSDW
jgi:hypothetical protein